MIRLRSEAIQGCGPILEGCTSLAQIEMVDRLFEDFLALWNWQAVWCVGLKRCVSVLHSATNYCVANNPITRVAICTL